MSGGPTSGLLLAFYGDDFTGSTDAMEALALRGISTVLFLEAPAPSDLARFPGCRAVGVAGMSRIQTPEWMKQNLPPVFRALKALEAPVCHYKVCSTFDSSPSRGNIGCAVELGREVFGDAAVPMVVGAPVLKRYLLFGNLFATAEGIHYRIDRHPTMSRHPITPMRESDLRLHLAHQTSLSTALVDILSLQAGRATQEYQRLRDEGREIVLFDTLDRQSLREAGRAIWERRPSGSSFVAGSSGVEYALLEWWDSLGMVPEAPVVHDPGEADRLLVVSGSCSPGTASQIKWSLQNGFTGVFADPVRVVEDESEFLHIVQEAEGILRSGGSPVIYTATGPGSIVAASDAGDLAERLGQRLGQLTSQLVRSCAVRRTVIAGGDTSGHAGRALRIKALTLLRPFAPGSPLCRIWSDDPQVDGGEILLKGGQVGGADLFGAVKRGRMENS